MVIWYYTSISLNDTRFEMVSAYIFLTYRGNKDKFVAFRFTTTVVSERL